MRILACFSRNRHVVLDESDPLAQVNNKDRKKDPKFDRATKPVPDPNVFVPTSIAELHPEYAHSEPYCFSARTDSARVIVEKMHETNGQPAPDRAEILKEQGLVVVRGPSYNASKATQVAVDANPKTKSVPLTIETPTTIDHSYAESDDSGHDENVDDRNITSNRKSSVSQSRKSLNSKTAVSQDKSKPKKSPAKSFRLKSRKNQKSLKPEPSTENVLQPRNSHGQQSSNLSAQDSSTVRDPSAIPTPPASDHSSETSEDELRKHMDNTPKELLAPIMVPRMSGAFPDSNRILSETKKQPRTIVESPVISAESWMPSDSSQRYEDVEGDNSSGFITMSAVGKEKVIHKATYSPGRVPLASSKGINIPTLPDTSSQSTVSHSMRSRRKSKPYVSTGGTIDTSAPILASPESAAADRLDDMHLSTEAGTIPEPAALSRQISVGVMSDDIQVIDTPALSSTKGGNEIVPLVTPSPREAARQRVHDDPLDLPSAAAQPQGIIRRASSTKRKTVSFHTASPTIIEPNLRAPASVPRSALLSKDMWRTSEVPKKPSFALRNARDSVALASSPVPKTMDANTISITRKQDRQDSFTSEDTFQERSSRRMSTRVVVKDRNELREASKRQSRAVASAMADQIKGVPKSAMLAYTENEIELSDTFEESEQESSLSSLRRRSRASKSIRVPEFIPGVVPAPPPPPPFAPDMPRARSIRTPPPPPASPLPH